MSDLFIGEILILILLLPVILRPFFSTLKAIEGLSLIPLIALFISVCVVLAFGFRVSFIPVLLLVLLLFFITFSRFYRFARGLTTDWFGLSSIISSFLCIVLFIGVLFLSIYFSPEGGRISEVNLLQEKTSQKVVFNKEVFLYKLAPASSSDSNASSPVQILYIPDPLFGLGLRGTAFQIFAENGWCVYEAELMPGKVFLFISMLSARFPSLGLQKKLEDLYPIERFIRMYESLLKNFNSSSLYVVAEGSGCVIAEQLFESDPTRFSGLVFVQNEPTLESASQNTFVLDGLESPLPVNSRTNTFLRITGKPGEFIGFGEIDSDDVLAAFAFGLQRDTGRKKAELFARRIGSWISFREGL